MNGAHRGQMIYPVILSGGVGSRLWPMSRERLPKQFLALASRGSLFEDTVRRVADESRFAAPVVVSSEAHRFLIAEQLRHIGVEPFALVVEQCRRNTALAAAVAAVMLGERDLDALMFLLPSDHVILDEAAFQATVEVAAAAARTGAMVTFGITPTRPETGYGYIRRGAALPGINGAFQIDRFVEKSDRAAAESYIAAGSYYWNSGMFLLPAALYLAELERLEPQILASCRRAVANGRSDLSSFASMMPPSPPRAPFRSTWPSWKERRSRPSCQRRSVGPTSAPGRQCGKSMTRMLRATSVPAMSSLRRRGAHSSTVRGRLPP